MPLASFVYDYTEDKDGMTGWVLKPEFNASSAITIGHDVVEHHKQDDGSIEHELMAFGAVLFGRYNMGYATDDGLAMDIAYLFTDNLYFTGDALVSDIKYVRKLKEDRGDYWVNETTIDFIVNLAYDYITKDLQENDYKIFKRDIKKYLKLAKKWIRKGFLMAYRKYKTPENMYAVYNTVIHEAKKVINDGYHGCKLKVTYQVFPEPKAWCKIIH